MSWNDIVVQIFVQPETAALTARDYGVELFDTVRTLEPDSNHFIGEYGVLANTRAPVLRCATNDSAIIASRAAPKRNRLTVIASAPRHSITSIAVARNVMNSLSQLPPIIDRSRLQLAAEANRYFINWDESDRFGFADMELSYEIRRHSTKWVLTKTDHGTARAIAEFDEEKEATFFLYALFQSFKSGGGRARWFGPEYLLQSGGGPTKIAEQPGNSSHLHGKNLYTVSNQLGWQSTFLMRSDALLYAKATYPPQARLKTSSFEQLVSDQGLSKYLFTQGVSSAAAPQVSIERHGALWAVGIVDYLGTAFEETRRTFDTEGAALFDAYDAMRMLKYLANAG